MKRTWLMRLNKGYIKMQRIIVFGAEASAEVMNETTLKFLCTMTCHLEENSLMNCVWLEENHQSWWSSSVVPLTSPCIRIMFVFWMIPCLTYGCQSVHASASFAKSALSGLFGGAPIKVAFSSAPWVLWVKQRLLWSRRQARLHQARVDLLAQS